MDRRVAWFGFASGVTIIAIMWLAYVPAQPSRDLAPGLAVQGLNPDLAIFERTVTLMRAGEPYYRAMDTALVSIASPPSAVRAFRPPTMFWLWARAPWLYTWPSVLGVILLSAWILARLSHPFAGLAIGLWLVSAVHPIGIQQWGYVELWTLPLMLAAVWAIRRDRFAAACALAFVAALTREFAVALLVGGALAAWKFRRPLPPWLAALTAWSGFMAWHIANARRWLDQDGSQAPLIGTGGWSGLLRNTGVLLGPVGLIVVVLALWRSRLTPEWWLVAPMLGGMTALGAVASRPYWSFLVLPVAVALLGAPGREGRTPDAREDLVVLPESAEVKRRQRLRR